MDSTLNINQVLGPFSESAPENKETIEEILELDELMLSAFAKKQNIWEDQGRVISHALLNRVRDEKGIEAVSEKELESQLTTISKLIAPVLLLTATSSGVVYFATMYPDLAPLATAITDSLTAMIGVSNDALRDTAPYLLATAVLSHLALNRQSIRDLTNKLTEHSQKMLGDTRRWMDEWAKKHPKHSKENIKRLFESIVSRIPYSDKISTAGKKFIKIFKPLQRISNAHKEPLQQQALDTQRTEYQDEIDGILSKLPRGVDSDKIALSLKHILETTLMLNMGKLDDETDMELRELTKHLKNKLKDKLLLLEVPEDLLTGDLLSKDDMQLVDVDALGELRRKGAFKQTNAEITNDTIDNSVQIPIEHTYKVGSPPIMGRIQLKQRFSELEHEIEKFTTQLSHRIAHNQVQNTLGRIQRIQKFLKSDINKFHLKEMAKYNPHSFQYLLDTNFDNYYARNQNTDSTHKNFKGSSNEIPLIAKFKTTDMYKQIIEDLIEKFPSKSAEIREIAARSSSEPRIPSNHIFLSQEDEISTIQHNYIDNEPTKESYEYTKSVLSDLVLKDSADIDETHLAKIQQILNKKPSEDLKQSFINVVESLQWYVVNKELSGVIDINSLNEVADIMSKSKISNLVDDATSSNFIQTSTKVVGAGIKETGSQIKQAIIEAIPIPAQVVAASTKETISKFKQALTTMAEEVPKSAKKILLAATASLMMGTANAGDYVPDLKYLEQTHIQIVKESAGNQNPAVADGNKGIESISLQTSNFPNKMN